LSAIGFTSALGPFWTLPTTFLSGTAAAGGFGAHPTRSATWPAIAGPYLVDSARRDGGYAGALLAFTLLMLAGAALALALRPAPAYAAPPNKSAEGREARRPAVPASPAR